MPTATLTSLAMLKVQIDHGGDYLNYLRPFILQILFDWKTDRVTDQSVRSEILEQFGLEIPQRTIQIVLRRLVKSNLLKREHGVYKISKNLPDPGLAAKKADAERHITALVSGLMEFSKDRRRPISIEDDAIVAISSFLSEFDITCLQAYLRGTTIPDLKGSHKTDIVLVSEYVIHLQKTDPERFESLMIMVQGHMLSNALLCPDLKNNLTTYKNTTFYLDTPLLIRRLGLEGIVKQDSISELISLLRRLNGKVATFQHSREELNRVIHGAADHISRNDGRGAIVMEARSQGTTKSDLLLCAEKVDDMLKDANIDVKPTPIYIPEFQISETDFERILEDEVSYFNPHAREYDINSVRSIYVLRKNTIPLSIERSNAILVTSNSKLSLSAWRYCKQHDTSCRVSTAITDFTLANVSWLKAPMGAPSLPKSEILAFSYAALQPSLDLLNKYMNEVNKLKEKNKITSRDHQLLRGSPSAYDELMDLTLGDERALTEETITETLNRVHGEITKEESEKTVAEKRQHEKTKQKLTQYIEKDSEIQENLYWRCNQKATKYSNILHWFLVAVLLIGFVSTFTLFTESTNPFVVWVPRFGFFALGLLGIINFYYGVTARKIRQQVQRWILVQLLKKGAKDYKINIERYL